MGSTRGLTDENGEVTDTYIYDAYGNVVGSARTTENDYLFAGEQWDETLGQYYLRQRFYDPNSGRFTRRDTYEGRLEEPITLHKYLYANSNPVSYVDPSGLFSLAETQAAANIANTLNEIQLDFGFEVVNKLLGGDDPSAASFGFNLAMASLPLFAGVNLPLPKIREGTALYKKLKNKRKSINYAIEAGRQSIENGKPYRNTIKGKLTQSEANYLGLEFLGKNAKQNPENPGEFYSADNLRRYRPGKIKSKSLYSKTGMQANFEERPDVNTDWKESINIHIDVEP